MTGFFDACVAAMIRPRRLVVGLIGAALLAGCATVPSPPRFSAAQIAVLTAQGFVEAEDAKWQLTLGALLLFDVDDAQLKPEQQAVLARLAADLAAVSITTARIDGHTDASGAAAYNLQLSARRAEAVANALRGGGMQFSPAQVVGRGLEFPVADNDTPEGKAANRRVVIIVSPQQ